MGRYFLSRWRVLALALLVTSWLSAAPADDSGVTQAKNNLQRQMDLLDAIKPYVERQDLGRLFLLRSASQEVLDAIINKGPMNLITIHAYENLILKFRYSAVYFDGITTTGTADSIKEAQNIAEDFAKQLNFDDSLYTQITFNTYDQMHKLVMQLLQMTISKELRQALEDMTAPLGQLTAMAKGGDNFDVWQAAVPCAKQIQKMYQLFYQVPSSDAAFHLVLEIQGLNEWFIEKTKIHVN